MAPPKEQVKATDFIPGYKEPEIQEDDSIERLNALLMTISLPVEGPSNA